MPRASADTSGQPINTRAAEAGRPGLGTPSAGPPGFLSGWRAGVALAALAASASCFLTAESLPIGLLPQVTASMHASLSTGGLLVTIYALIVVTLTMPLTRLTRDVPRRFLLAGVAAALLVGSVASAAAPDLGVLIAARICTASAQAVFWATGPLEAASLVRPERRGRALTAVFGGSAGGQVLGLPAVTAIGHAAGWRVAFLALGTAAVLLLAAILYALPTRPPRPPHADAQGASDRRRYRVLIAFTGLAVTANFAMFTYTTAFLVRISGVPRSAIAVVLWAAGLVSTVGLSTATTLYARHRRATIPVSFAFMLLALIGMFLLAHVALLAAVCVALAGLGQSIFTVAGITAVIEVKPSNGSAWYSTAYNVGIGAGPIAGGVALQTWGLRATPLTGAAIGLVALTLLLGGDPTLRRRR
ncbi:MAG TPA: MFS transporter [Solirubrobacteraceae bacterium]|nr:MFS transporter [Solirubrobacteraceae bacterium]